MKPAYYEPEPMQELMPENDYEPELMQELMPKNDFIEFEEVTDMKERKPNKLKILKQKTPEEISKSLEEANGVKSRPTEYVHGDEFIMFNP